VNDDTPGSTRPKTTAAASDAPVSTLAPITYGLSEELIADGARRFAVVAGTLGGIVALAAVGQYLAGPDGWGRPGHTIALFLVGLSVAVVAIARSRRLASSLILDLALLYAIAVSLGVSMMDNLVAWPEAGFVRGVSWVCVWIVLFPVLVPITPGKAWLAASASAAMGPLAYLIAIAGGNEAAPWVTVASLYAPNFASVVLAGIGARIVYSLASEVNKAQRALTRRLSAIMFTDMVGFTALMQDDEHRAKSIRDRHRNALRQSIETHGGEIVQFYGDGTLSVFPSAVEAVSAAVAAQQKLQQTPSIPVRIGLHIGDINRDEDGVYGDGVNVAARIQGISVAGAVMISGKVFDEIKNHPDLPATALGEFALKNVRRPVRVFAITVPGLVVPQPESIVSTGASDPSL
jgi:class 3 adenylate cyclase